ncbi:MAG: L-threonylcarbamoyladenylate synthase [Clostridia bacterium]|nr:L-threonylcarbamoyladenylate synthase [Clostridia bacterium]MDR3643673.1 L-threonylcarbamoyladenylate synthase [Clostridia bacterium]
MTTTVLKTDPSHIDEKVILSASAALKAGELVAIPTETVYGLAANALDAHAVEKIFIAKGRPQDNPLIVHIADPAGLSLCAAEVPESALRLAKAFWPGPLTMILKKTERIPGIVSAGLPSVALRMPSHPVAAAVIHAAGLPLAAPSANLSGSPSPTSAAHVFDDLNGRIGLIIDGGDCGVGVESTVVTLCGDTPRVLRPGGITPEQLAAVLGGIEIDPAVTKPLAKGARAASPGMKYRHYAPRTRVVIVHGSLAEFAALLKSRRASGERCAALCFEGEEALVGRPALAYGIAGDAASQARKLFGALRAVDALGAETVYARCPPREGVGLAVYNRLLRAAAFQEIAL